MNRHLTLVVIILSLTGCVSTPEVRFDDLSNESKSNLKNELQKDSYPSQMAGTGNLYSCRYGIWFKKSTEFHPSKEVIFSELLKKYSPEIEGRDVSLLRFDVYFNTRIKSLKSSAKIISGNSSVNILNPRVPGGPAFFLNYKNLLVDKIPDTYPIDTDENAVGCDGENEGEYYRSRVPSGSNIVVVWLKFRIDETGYTFRTVYPVLPAKNTQELADGIKNAIKLSIEAISKNVVK